MPARVGLGIAAGGNGERAGAEDPRLTRHAGDDAGRRSDRPSCGPKPGANVKLPRGSGLQDDELHAAFWSRSLLQRAIAEEAHPAVIGGIPDERASRGAALTQHVLAGGDQRPADAAPLQFRPDGDRAQAEPTVVAAIDRHGREGDMSDDAVALDGDQGNGQIAILAQGVDDPALGAVAAASWRKPSG